MYKLLKLIFDKMNFVFNFDSVVPLPSYVLGKTVLNENVNTFLC